MMRFTRFLIILCFAAPYVAAADESAKQPATAPATANVPPETWPAESFTLVGRIIPSAYSIDATQL